MTLRLPGSAKAYLQSCITKLCSKIFTLPDVYMVCVMSSKHKATGVAQIYTAADCAAVSPAAGHCVNTPSENAKQRLPVRLPALFYNLCIQPKLNSVTALPNRLYPSWPTLGKRNTSSLRCMSVFQAARLWSLLVQLEGWCKTGRRVCGVRKALMGWRQMVGQTFSQ